MAKKRQDYWGGGFNPLSVDTILFELFISLIAQLIIYIKSEKLSNWHENIVKARRKKNIEKKIEQRHNVKIYNY